MRRRRAIQLCGTAIAGSLVGCTGDGSENRVDDTGSTKTTQRSRDTTKNAQTQTEKVPTAKIDWSYTEVENRIHDYDYRDGTCYLVDGGGNLIKIDTETGQRQWYKSPVGGGTALSVITAGDYPVVYDRAANMPYYYVYRSSGKMVFEAFASDFVKGTVVNTASTTIGGPENILSVLKFQTENERPCNAIVINPKTRGVRGTPKWYTGGPMAMHSGGMIVGGTASFPSAIQRTTESHEIDWATNLGGATVTDIDIVSGTIFASTESKESVGMVTLNGDGKIKSQINIRGDPSEGVELLDRPVELPDGTVLPTLTNGGENVYRLHLFDETGEMVGERSVGQKINAITSFDKRALVALQGDGRSILRTYSLPDLTINKEWRLGQLSDGRFIQASETPLYVSPSGLTSLRLS